MRIAMVGPFGFAPNKTMRARALRLAAPLAAAGHAVQIVMPPWQTPAEAGRSWTEAGVAIRYTALRGGLPGTTAALVRAALAWRPDVVHCFKPKAYSGLAAWWLWYTRRGLPLVVDSDDWEGAGGWNDRAPYSGAQKRFFAWQERWGLRHCDALTVASRTLESLSWAHGVAPARVTYLPNGSGIGRPANAAVRRAGLGLTDRPVLLLYSRLFEFNVDRLLSVLVRAREALPELALLFVGAGLYQAEAAALRAGLTNAGLDQNVVDVGWLPEAELPDTLAAADIGLYLMDDTLLNRTKCPVKLADMLQVGVPVVAEAVGQVPEYVRDGYSGRLCAAGDADGLAAAVVDLLLAAAVRKRLAAGAQAHIAADFAWPRLAEKLAGVYEGLLDPG